MSGLNTASSGLDANGNPTGYTGSNAVFGNGTGYNLGYDPSLFPFLQTSFLQQNDPKGLSELNSGNYGGLVNNYETVGMPGSTPAEQAALRQNITTGTTQYAALSDPKALIGFANNDPSVLTNGAYGKLSSSDKTAISQKAQQLLQQFGGDANKAAAYANQNADAGSAYNAKGGIGATAIGLELAPAILGAPYLAGALGAGAGASGEVAGGTGASTSLGGVASDTLGTAPAADAATSSPGYFSNLLSALQGTGTGSGAAISGGSGAATVGDVASAAGTGGSLLSQLGSSIADNAKLISAVTGLGISAATAIAQQNALQKSQSAQAASTAAQNAQQAVFSNRISSALQQKPTQQQKYKSPYAYRRGGIVDKFATGGTVGGDGLPTAINQALKQQVGYTGGFGNVQDWINWAKANPSAYQQFVTLGQQASPNFDPSVFGITLPSSTTSSTSTTTPAQIPGGALGASAGQTISQALPADLTHYGEQGGINFFQPTNSSSAPVLQGDGLPMAQNQALKQQVGYTGGFTDPTQWQQWAVANPAAYAKFNQLASGASTSYTPNVNFGTDPNNVQTFNQVYGNGTGIAGSNPADTQSYNNYTALQKLGYSGAMDPSSEQNYIQTNSIKPQELQGVGLDPSQFTANKANGGLALAHGGKACYDEGGPTDDSAPDDDGSSSSGGNSPLGVANIGNKDGYVPGQSPGQEDDIDAKLSSGEFVIPADVVSHLGDGNTNAGSAKLYKLMREIRQHKGMKPKLPPKSKPIEKYMASGKKST